MGEYKNTYQRIEMLKIRKIELIEQINELHEGYLAKLRDIDGEAC